jgi:hypothetical protein
MKLPVYYNPSDPSVGVLKTGIPPMHVGLLIGLGIGTIVFPIISVFVIRGWLRARKQAADSAPLIGPPISPR